MFGAWRSFAESKFGFAVRPVRHGPRPLATENSHDRNTAQSLKRPCCLAGRSKTSRLWSQP